MGQLSTNVLNGKSSLCGCTDFVVFASGVCLLLLGVRV